MASPPEDKMLQLIYVPEFAIADCPKRFQIIINILRAKMAEECGIGNRAYYKPQSEEGSVLNGFFILTNRKQIFCAGMWDGGKIVTRYTPPPHRQKGFATEFLRQIEKAFAPYPIFPLWVVSYERMFSINERAGWVNMGEATRGVGGEKEYDFSPPSKVEMYKQFERDGGKTDPRLWTQWLDFVMKETIKWDCFEDLTLRLK